MSPNDKERDTDVNLNQIPLGETRNGNYLEALALSVTLFFLATTWLTHGQIFSDFSSTYDSIGGKASFYKSVDAESVLTQDFNREFSSVLF